MSGQEDVGFEVLLDGGAALDNKFIQAFQLEYGMAGIKTRFRPETIALKFIEKLAREGATLRDFVSSSVGSADTFYSVPIGIFQKAASEAAQTETARRGQNNPLPIAANAATERREFLFFSKVRQAAGERNLDYVAVALKSIKDDPALFRKVIAILEQSGWLEPGMASEPDRLLQHLENRRIDEAVDTHNSARMAELIANAKSDRGEATRLVERCVMKSWMDPLSLVLSNNNGESFKNHAGSGTISTFGDLASIAASGIDCIMCTSAANVNGAKAAALESVASYPRPDAEEQQPKAHSDGELTVQSAKKPLGKAVPEAGLAASPSVEKCRYYLENYGKIRWSPQNAERPTGMDWKRALRHWGWHGGSGIITEASESQFVSSKTRRLARNALTDIHVRETLELINDKKRFADYRRQIESARPKARSASALHESQLANEARLRRQQEIEQQKLFLARRAVAEQQAREARLSRIHSMLY